MGASEPRTRTVRLFAGARQAAGCDRLQVTGASDATAAQWLELLAQQHDGLAAFAPSCRLAVGDRYLADDEVPPPAAELVLIPPVSGG